MDIWILQLLVFHLPAFIASNGKRSTAATKAITHPVLK